MDNFGWRTRITLYPRDISSTSESFHVCEQSYATDLAPDLEYSSAVFNCKLLFTSVQLKLCVIESVLIYYYKMCALIDKFCIFVEIFMLIIYSVGNFSCI